MYSHHPISILCVLAALSIPADASSASNMTWIKNSQDTASFARAAALEPLRDRPEYAALDKDGVADLARVAPIHWPQQFSGFNFLRVERFAVGAVSHWVSIWSHKKTGIEFVLIPGGRFQMGSPSSEQDRNEDERQHWLSLDPFLIARTECTQEAWTKGTTESDSKDVAPDGSAQFPKSGLSPVDVEKWSVTAGLMMPTEAQWEFMCQAGMTSAWAMGAEKSDLKTFGNLGSAECPDGWKQISGLTEAWGDGFGAETAPVGTFAPNAFGLFDVHGNVSEWIRDHYFSFDVRAELGTGLRPGTSGERMARGGNYGGDAAFARAANRPKFGAGISPGANNGFGFRPSMDLPFPVSFGGWPEETFPLPPGFAPGLATGVESLRFTPGWRNPDSEDFWSYAFIMWVDEPAPDIKRVGELVDGYYDGLMSVFARNAGQDIGNDPAEVAVEQIGLNLFEVDMYVVDAFATFDQIPVRVVVEVVAEADAKSSVRVQLSPQPPEHGVWRSLEAAIASIEKP